MAKKLFPKALQSFKTCASVNNNLSEKLFLSIESPTTFDESFSKLLQVTLLLTLIYYVVSKAILPLKC